MLGARDFLTKPTGEGGLEEKVAWIAENLEPKLRALGPARRATDAARPRPARRVAAALPSEAGTERLARRRDVVAIGSSAGGLPVLRQLLAELPGSLGVPLVCVQHMPAGFTASLARSLERSSPGWTVAEAENGALLEPGWR